MPDAYAGWKLEPATPQATPAFAGWRLEQAPTDEAPPEPYHDPRAAIGDAVAGGVKSALNWATTPFESAKPQIEENRAIVDKAGPAPINRLLGYDTKNEPDWLTGAKALIGGAMPGRDPYATSTAEAERAGRFQSEHPIKSFLLSTAGSMAMPGHLPASVPKAPGAATSWLQRLEARLTSQVGDAGVKGAEDTARSAMGSYRSARGDTSTILKALERVTGDPATDAASKALLESPAGKKLIMEVVKNAQERAPQALDRVEGLKALVDETHAAIPAARATATADDTLKSVLAQRTKDQIGRYAIPAVAGAVGAHVAGPVGFGIGTAAGRGVSPGVRAVVMNNVLAPERRLLMTRGALNMAQKLAGTPERLGKFALPITQAAQKGPDSLAATHYILAQDPEYQEMMHAQGDEQ